MELIVYINQLQRLKYNMGNTRDATSYIPQTYHGFGFSNFQTDKCKIGILIFNMHNTIQAVWYPNQHHAHAYFIQPLTLFIENTELKPPTFSVPNRSKQGVSSLFLGYPDPIPSPSTKKERKDSLKRRCGCFECAWANNLRSTCSMQRGIILKCTIIQ